MLKELLPTSMRGYAQRARLTAGRYTLKLGQRLTRLGERIGGSGKPLATNFDRGTTIKIEDLLGSLLPQLSKLNQYIRTLETPEISHQRPGQGIDWSTYRTTTYDRDGHLENTIENRLLHG